MAAEVGLLEKLHRDREDRRVLPRRGTEPDYRAANQKGSNIIKKRFALGLNREKQAPLLRLPIHIVAKKKKGCCKPLHVTWGRGSGENCRRIDPKPKL